jgi:hypothetical protein
MFKGKGLPKPGAFQLWVGGSPRAPGPPPRDERGARAHEQVADEHEVHEHLEPVRGVAPVRRDGEPHSDGLHDGHVHDEDREEAVPSVEEVRLGEKLPPKLGPPAVGDVRRLEVQHVAAQ